MSEAFLILQNGRVFAGERFATDADIMGELVFTTGMSGYLETVTDPSYAGQIVLQTFPLIGNYGVNVKDAESARPALKAYIVRELCKTPSNFRSVESLEDFLCRHGVVGLSGVDTRALTRIIRAEGVMNAAIVSSLADRKKIVKQLNAYRFEHAVASVTPAARPAPAENSKYRVALWDFGAKAGIVRALEKRGVEVCVFVAESTAEQILGSQPDGILLSNGPGDPKENVAVIAEIKKLFGRQIPIFGICLGHQLMALAKGADTKKLKFGHRGANQPVYAKKRGRVFITSQNHGYTVDEKTLPEGAEADWVNGNDGTCEGVSYDARTFSVQFHPEAGAGPLDTDFLFDEFIEMLKEGQACR